MIYTAINFVSVYYYQQGGSRFLPSPAAARATVRTMCKVIIKKFHARLRHVRAMAGCLSATEEPACLQAGPRYVHLLPPWQSVYPALRGPTTPQSLLPVPAELAQCLPALPALCCRTSHRLIHRTLVPSVTRLRSVSALVLRGRGQRESYSCLSVCVTAAGTTGPLLAAPG